jgi:aspartyl-tRNA(Asn)/glutamyl-tRNA(Gln) amidotransferase subunit C
MKISREDVLRVAELAHLELSEAEAATYLQQLDSILSYIEKLNELDTSNVEPMAQSLAGTAGAGDRTLRDDAVQPSDLAESVLAIAPDPGKPYFRVPKVIEK